LICYSHSQISELFHIFKTFVTYLLFPYVLLKCTVNIALEDPVFQRKHFSKITVFWDVTLCSLVEKYQHSGGTCYIHLQGIRVRDECIFVPDYTSHPRRQ
jgi:hypothetical protein